MTIHLLFGVHAHQPVGNFDGVFEKAYNDSYQPFLDVLQDYPEIAFGLHTSGSLLATGQHRLPSKPVPRRTTLCPARP